MKKFLRSALIAAFSLVSLGVFLPSCEEHSDNIPTSYPTVSSLMEEGWAQYAAGDYEAARQSFFDASSRNALYLPAYNGLGWCAVRLTDFSQAEIRFSFITTLANPETQADLLADAYAGLCLSSAIHRSVAEISGTGDPAFWQSLALESIQYADSVFSLQGEGYDPADHDPNFGSQSLHLLNAQNYFYLQEFEESEAELSIVDSAFVPNQLEIYGQSEADTIELAREVSGEDTTWYLPMQPVDTTGASIVAGIHHYSELAPPDSVIILTDSLDYAQNRIIVTLAGVEPVEPQLGMKFVVSYVYIINYAQYLNDLIEHIEALI